MRSHSEDYLMTIEEIKAKATTNARWCAAFCAGAAMLATFSYLAEAWTLYGIDLLCLGALATMCLLNYSMAGKL